MELRFKIVILKVFEYVMWLGLALNTTSIEMYGENFNEASILVCLVGASNTFEILGIKFI